MVRNRQTKLIIGIIAALFLASFVCCSGVILLGTMFNSTESSGKKRKSDDPPTKVAPVDSDTNDEAKDQGRSVE